MENEKKLENCILKKNAFIIQEKKTNMKKEKY